MKQRRLHKHSKANRKRQKTANGEIVSRGISSSSESSSSSYDSSSNDEILAPIIKKKLVVALEFDSDSPKEVKKIQD